MMAEMNRLNEKKQVETKDSLISMDLREIRKRQYEKFKKQKEENKSGWDGINYLGKKKNKMEVEDSVQQDAQSTDHDGPQEYKPRQLKPKPREYMPRRRVWSSKTQEDPKVDSPSTEPVTNKQAPHIPWKVYNSKYGQKDHKTQEESITDNTT